MMTSSPELYILDVGHGNCAIVRQADETLIVDANLGNTHIVALRELGVTRVSRVLLSHLDTDHMGGAATLLYDPDITVEEVRFNPDATKKRTESFQTLRDALADARRRGPVRVQTQLTSELTTELSFANVKVEVLLPDALDTASGPGGTGMDATALNSNTLSAVIRIGFNGKSFLLPGDLDRAGLNRLATLKVDATADVLVFPHHGGLPRSAQPYQFAYDLCKLVNPSTVVFSISRGGKSTNPQPDIVRGLLDARSDARIICTQLSKRCAADLPNPPREDHLAAFPAAGRVRHQCCGGSVSIDIMGGLLNISPAESSHVNFITDHAPAALCQRLRNPLASSRTGISASQAGRNE